MELSQPGEDGCGLQRLHYVSGPQLCADVAAPHPCWPQLVRMGPLALGNPGMQYLYCSLPVAPSLATLPSISLFSYLLTRFTTSEHFGGLLGKGRQKGIV